MGRGTSLQSIDGDVEDDGWSAWTTWWQCQWRW